MSNLRLQTQSSRADNLYLNPTYRAWAKSQPARQKKVRASDSPPLLPPLSLCVPSRSNNDFPGYDGASEQPGQARAVYCRVDTRPSQPEGGGVIALSLSLFFLFFVPTVVGMAKKGNASKPIYPLSPLFPLLLQRVSRFGYLHADEAYLVRGRSCTRQANGHRFATFFCILNEKKQIRY